MERIAIIKEMIKEFEVLGYDITPLEMLLNEEIEKLNKINLANAIEEYIERELKNEKEIEDITKEEITEKVEKCFEYEKDLIVYYINGKILRYENNNNMLESEKEIYFKRTKNKLVNKLYRQLTNKNYIERIRIGR